MVEHEQRVIADSDWIIDLGPGAGDRGGSLVVQGTPAQVAASGKGATSDYWHARSLRGHDHGPLRALKLNGRTPIRATVIRDLVAVGHNADTDARLQASSRLQAEGWLACNVAEKSCSGSPV